MHVGDEVEQGVEEPVPPGGCSAARRAEQFRDEVTRDLELPVLDTL